MPPQTPKPKNPRSLQTNLPQLYYAPSIPETQKTLDLYKLTYLNYILPPLTPKSKKPSISTKYWSEYNITVSSYTQLIGSPNLS